MGAFGRRRDSPTGFRAVLSVPLHGPPALPKRKQWECVDHSLCPRRSPMKVSRNGWVTRSISKNILVWGTVACVTLLVFGSFALGHPSSVTYHLLKKYSFGP